MKLKFQENIDKINNCPSDHEEGERILFRCVEKKLSQKSFTPNAVLLKPRFQDNCIAWGLSVFSSFDSASQTLKSLSKNKRVNYARIAKAKICNEDGIKHTSKNKKHYTFFPSEQYNCVENFEILNDEI